MSKKTKTTRSVTINCLMQKRKCGYVYVPQIILSGIWLQNAGYKSGNKIKIKLKPNGQLLVSPVG